MTYEVQKGTLYKTLLEGGLSTSVANDTMREVESFNQECAGHDIELERAVIDLAPELDYTSEEAQDFARIYRGRSVQDTTDMMRKIRWQIPALFDDYD